MVNTLNISAYEGRPPASENADRKIIGGPLYSTGQVLKILEGGENILRSWTRKAISDQKKYDLNHSDVIELVTFAVKKGHFLSSWWCTAKPGGPWAACDSYQVWNDEWIDAAAKYMTIEYYVKFAVNKTGKMIFTISCHPSEDRS